MVTEIPALGTHTTRMILSNLENFPFGMISDVNEDELDFFTGESSSRFLKELSKGILKNLSV